MATELSTGGTKEAAILGAMMKLCKPCCGYGGGSAGIQYTDCRCAYPYQLFDGDGNPQPPGNPPPQPAGGYFPTIMYYQADLDGGTCSCYNTTESNLSYCNGPVTPVVYCTTFSSATSVGYCGRSVNIPLKLCPLAPDYPCIPGAYCYQSDDIPLCDITITFSNGWTITVRRFLKIDVTVTCSSCVIIDEAWIIDRFRDSYPDLDNEQIIEMYASWVGLEYCEPSVITTSRAILYRALSNNATAFGEHIPVRSIGTGVGGCGGGKLEEGEGITYNPAACAVQQLGAGGYGAGGQIEFAKEGYYCCTNLVIECASQIVQSQTFFCCYTNDLAGSFSTRCCKPINEKIYVPGACS